MEAPLPSSVRPHCICSTLEAAKGTNTHTYTRTFGRFQSRPGYITAPKLTTGMHPTGSGGDESKQTTDQMPFDILEKESGAYSSGEAETCVRVMSAGRSLCLGCAARGCSLSSSWVSPRLSVAFSFSHSPLIPVASPRTSRGAQKLC